MNRTWFKLEAGFFKKDEWTALGAHAAMCHLYLQEYSKIDSKSEEGWVNSLFWNVDCIWNWLGCLQSRFEKDELRTAMTQLKRRKIIITEGDGVTLSDLNDEVREIKKADGRARVAKHRKSPKKKKPDETQEGYNVTSDSYNVTSENSDVTQREEREEREENNTSNNVVEVDSNTTHVVTNKNTEVVDLSKPVKGFDGHKVIPGSDAAKIKETFPELPDFYCIETINKLKYWRSRLGSEFNETLEAALANFPVGRDPLKDKNGLHGYITTFMSIRHEKKKEAEAKAKKEQHTGGFALVERITSG